MSDGNGADDVHTDSGGAGVPFGDLALRRSKGEEYKVASVILFSTLRGILTA
jgi:hypothetical protein